MNKSLKIFLIIIIVIVLIAGGLFVYFTLFFQPEPEPKGPEANTYSEDSDINFLEYAVKFTEGDIILEDSVNFSNGKLNGYNVTNSTINKNCTINNETRLISISLYKSVQVTIRNINGTGLYIILHDHSSLTLENCIFNYIWLLDSSSVIIKNSTIGVIIVRSPSGDSRGFNYETAISISSSWIEEIAISNGCDLLIKNCTFIGYDSLTINTFSPTTRVMGNIENSTLWLADLEGYANLKFYGSILYSLFVDDMACATLIQSKITNYFRYGIIAYSGTTNIVDGRVTGSDYHNNTKLVDSDVPTPLLNSVAANSSAIVNMNNYSCSVYLHDFSSVNITNVPDDSYFPYFLVTLRDSSSLTIEDANFDWGYLECMDNSTVVIKNSQMGEIFCDTSNSITIDDSVIYHIMTFFEYRFLANLAVDHVYITNSSISYLTPGGSDVLYIENCTINSLSKSAIIYSGSLTLDSGIFSGMGNYKNFTTIANTTIYSSEFRYIEINGSAHLSIQDNFDNLYVFCQDNAELTCKNSTIKGIIGQDNTKFSCKNSTIYRIIGEDATTLMVENSTIYEITLTDDSILNVSHNSDIWYIITKGESIASITDAKIEWIIILESSRVSVLYSSLINIAVFGSNTEDYTVKIYDSTVEYLTTYSWS